LYFDREFGDGQHPRAELDAEGGFVVGAEAALGEAQQETGFADTFVNALLLESPIMMNFNR
jgi:hypothetical protein